MIILHWPGQNIADIHAAHKSHTWKKISHRLQDHACLGYNR